MSPLLLRPISPPSSLATPSLAKARIVPPAGIHKRWFYCADFHMLRLPLPPRRRAAPPPWASYSRAPPAPSTAAPPRGPTPRGCGARSWRPRTSTTRRVVEWNFSSLCRHTLLSPPDMPCLPRCTFLRTRSELTHAAFCHLCIRNRRQVSFLGLPEVASLADVAEKGRGMCGTEWKRLEASHVGDTVREDTDTFIHFSSQCTRNHALLAEDSDFSRVLADQRVVCFPTDTRGPREILLRLSLHGRAATRRLRRGACARPPAAVARRPSRLTCLAWQHASDRSAPLLSLFSRRGCTRSGCSSRMRSRGWRSIGPLGPSSQGTGAGGVPLS